MLQTTNVVIGTAIGYTTDEIKNFVLSFREHNHTADMVMFLDRTSLEQSRNFLTTFNVTPLLFETLGYFHMFTPRNVAFNSRFIRNYEFLYTSTQYKHVLLSDTRDVVFQRDPFLDLPEEFLYFFTEDTHVSIGQNAYNTEWMMRDYGEEVFNAIKDMPIICSGTIFGSRNHILNYLNCLLNEMLIMANNRSPETMVVDQTITTYLAHLYPYEQLQRTVKISGDIVGTIGVSSSQAEHDNPRDEIVFDMGKIFVNGMLPAIIHQYDRNKFLMDYFNIRYSTNKRLN